VEIVACDFRGFRRSTELTVNPLWSARTQKLLRISRDHICG